MSKEPKKGRAATTPAHVDAYFEYRRKREEAKAKNPPESKPRRHAKKS